ncbi:glycosyltransferase family 32 protein [Rhodobacter maris]|uniref:Alpha 1,4-glycosyltransferase n=1 Tax=Rhodobacter maris TaxID=446682 RepID=A0A285SND6_9RHOB|nr:hypothetical protein [Rhodobacter maris]SOC08983.1 hypothetical protein SAMN05877831_10743 [Rhodobacter maris]
MAHDYQIAALWIGGSLSYLEQLCLKSFLDVGHHVKLYSYEPIDNAPEGCEMADANEVLSQENFLRHGRTNSPALHSDLFRYHLLAKNDRTIWADTDAYCVKPFETETGHFYAWESAEGINGGVLGLPPDSETLQALLGFTSDEYAIPSWYGDEYQRELEEKKAAGEPVHAGEMPWGVWGPHAITHFLKTTGEVRHAMPIWTLYPFEYADRALMLRPGYEWKSHIKPDTYSIHFYGRRMRARLIEKFDGVPRPRSMVGRLLKKHGIDPALAPLRLPAGAAPETDAEE